MPIHLHTARVCFHTLTGLYSCQQRPHDSQTFTVWSFEGKSLPTLDLEFRSPPTSTERTPCLTGYFTPFSYRSLESFSLLPYNLVLILNRSLFLLPNTNALLTFFTSPGLSSCWVPHRMSPRQSLLP